MPFTDDTVEVLAEAGCRALLATAHVGRVAVSIGALPVILPVNFALLDDDVVFLTDGGAKLDAAFERAVVAFEVDEVDEATHTGWSVLVIGHASAIRNAADLERARGLDLRPWAPGPREHYVRVESGMISGRRINPGTTRSGAA